jgi:TPR repeat protein
LPWNYADALKLLRKASDVGNAGAQNCLGTMYAEGRGVPQNHAEAVTWYRKAAEQGNASAQLNLGVAYHIGRGVPQDYVIAHMWFNLAATSDPALRTHDDAVYNRDKVASKMTPAQITEAQKRASEWKPK